MNVALKASFAGSPNASGSSFYAAMRVLPREQRQAMFAIYGFCRAVDDIADGDLVRPARMEELARWRSEIDALFAGAATPRVRPLVEPVRKFNLDPDDFRSIVDGMRMDAIEDIRAPDAATLDLYCDRVACAVGRLSVRVFGMPKTDGQSLAACLGRALQLTNILRDLDTDADRGRLYLSRQVLADAGIRETDPHKVLDHPAICVACTTVAGEARRHFASANSIMSRYSLRLVRAPLLMAKTYQNLLDRLQQRGWAPQRRAIHTDRVTLLWILFRHGLIKLNTRP